MTITFFCPNPECQRPFNIEDEFAGRKAKCDDCQTVVTIPAAETVAPSPVRVPLPASPVPKKQTRRFFYMDANGRKQGPVDGKELKQLAARGIVKPETPIKSSGGQKSVAGQVPGLFVTPPPLPNSATPRPAPSPPPVVAAVDPRPVVDTTLRPQPPEDTPSMPHSFRGVDSKFENKAMVVNTKKISERGTTSPELKNAKDITKNFSISSALRGLSVAVFDGVVIFLIGGFWGQPLQNNQPLAETIIILITLIVLLNALICIGMQGYGIRYPGIISPLLRLASSLLRSMRRKIHSMDYDEFLNVLKALKNNGYEIDVIRDKFNIKEVGIKRYGNTCGWVFVVADRAPCLLFAIIGVFWNGFQKYIHEESGTYNHMIRVIKIVSDRFKRKGYKVFEDYDEDKYFIGVYWPEGSNVGCYTNDPNKEYDVYEWLHIARRAMSDS